MSNTRKSSKPIVYQDENNTNTLYLFVSRLPPDPNDWRYIHNTTIESKEQNARLILEEKLDKVEFTGKNIKLPEDLEMCDPEYKQDRLEIKTNQGKKAQIHVYKGTEDLVNYTLEILKKWNFEVRKSLSLIGYQ